MKNDEKVLRAALATVVATTAAVDAATAAVDAATAAVNAAANALAAAREAMSAAQGKAQPWASPRPRPAPQVGRPAGSSRPRALKQFKTKLRAVARLLASGRGGLN